MFEQFPVDPMFGLFADMCDKHLVFDYIAIFDLYANTQMLHV